MSRHPIDKSEDSAAGRARRYLWLDRITAGSAAHPAVRLLNRRRRKGGDAARVVQFLRIERGYLA